MKISFKERDVRKYIKIGTLVENERSFEPAKVIGIELCESEGMKEGIPMDKVFVGDKNRCIFDLDNGHWQYGYQVEVANA
jgi:hypothetical protein